MKLYLAGPMRGYEEFNFPAFHANAKALRAMGHTVFSPAEKDEEQHGKAAFQAKVELQDQVAEAVGFSLREALCMDLTYICKEADGIALQRGWEMSKGAIAESSTANALGLKRYVETDQGWIEIDSGGRVVLMPGDAREVSILRTVN